MKQTLKKHFIYWCISVVATLILAMLIFKYIKKDIFEIEAQTKAFWEVKFFQYKTYTFLRHPLYFYFNGALALLKTPLFYSIHIVVNVLLFIIYLSLNIKQNASASIKPYFLFVPIIIFNSLVIHPSVIVMLLALLMMYFMLNKKIFMAIVIISIMGAITIYAYVFLLLLILFYPYDKIIYYGLGVNIVIIILSILPYNIALGKGVFSLLYWAFRYIETVNSPQHHLFLNTLHHIAPSLNINILFSIQLQVLTFIITLNCIMVYGRLRNNPYPHKLFISLTAMLLWFGIFVWCNAYTLSIILVWMYMFLGLYNIINKKLSYSIAVIVIILYAILFTNSIFNFIQTKTPSIFILELLLIIIAVLSWMMILIYNVKKNFIKKEESFNTLA